MSEELLLNPWQSNSASLPPPVVPLGIQNAPTEVLLVVFIHGFKGTDDTFAEFPQRLQHLLSETVDSTTQVECLVFPAYETKGELDKAVIRLSDWLTTLTVEREVACGGGAGKAKIVLCGHSMGGLLAADTLRAFIESRPDETCPLWPKIIACIAFDTPYLGIHPFVVKNSVTKASEYASAATTVGFAILGSFAAFSSKGTPATTPTPAQSSQTASWGKWGGPALAIGGALLAGAAAGGAYYKRDDLTQGFSWATDHMKFVGNLWDENVNNKRVDELVEIEKKHGVVFRNIYCFLPPKLPEFLTSRTFVVLPKYTSGARNHFVPANNTVAADEIQSHTGMFSASTNDGYYQLGLATAKIIRDAMNSKPVSPTRSTKSTNPMSPGV